MLEDILGVSIHDAIVPPSQSHSQTWERGYLVLSLLLAVILYMVLLAQEI